MLDKYPSGRLPASLTPSVSALSVSTFVSAHTKQSQKAEDGNFVCGFLIPEGHTRKNWSVEHQIAFVEDVIVELPIGTLAIRKNTNSPSIVIDGVERLAAIEAFITGKIRAFDKSYSDLIATNEDSSFDNAVIPSFVYVHGTIEETLRMIKHLRDREKLL